MCSSDLEPGFKEVFDSGVEWVLEGRRTGRIVADVGFTEESGIRDRDTHVSDIHHDLLIERLRV